MPNKTWLGSQKVKIHSDKIFYKIKALNFTEFNLFTQSKKKKNDRKDNAWKIVIRPK